MRLAVLGAPDSWYFRDLCRAAGPGTQVVALPFSRLAAHLGSDKLGFWSVGTDLDSFDAVLVRTMPPGSLEQVVFRMDVLARLEAAGTVVINPPKAVEVAVDKYLALAKLHAAGMRVPETTVCQTVDDAFQAFDAFGQDVVVKPLFGSEGRGLIRVSDQAIAERVFKTLIQLNAVLYVQRFVPHQGFDLRLLTLGDQVFCMQRRNVNDWRMNVSRGARAEVYPLTDELADLAQQAARAIGATFAGIDVLPSSSGEPYLLEVNAVPGWRALANTLRIDVADLVLQHAAQLIEARSA